MKAKTFKRKRVDPVFKPASLAQISYLESLLFTSLLSTEKQKKILNDAHDSTEGELEEKIQYVLENQRCNISGGFNYTMGDISKKLKNARDPK